MRSVERGSEAADCARWVVGHSDGAGLRLWVLGSETTNIVRQGPMHAHSASITSSGIAQRAKYYVWC